MKPLNVLHVMTKLPVGGVENQLLTVLGKYDKSRFSPFVCSLSDKGPIGIEIEKLGIEVVTVNKLRNRFDWSIVKDVCRIIKEKDISIVRTHQYHANLYGRLAAKKARVPCIVASVHNVYTRDRKLHRRLLNRYLARFTDKVVAVSGAVKDDIMKYDALKEDKLEVICNGVDIDRFSKIDCSALKSELNIPPEVPVIGTVGRLTLQKGQKYLLESISQLKDKFPGIVLLVVGDGPLRAELERYAEKLGINNNVQFLGTRRDIPELLSAMDIFVLPSLWEGLVNALIEAMAAGKPVIATDIRPIREIIDSEDAGILVPPEDSGAIFGAVELLLRNKDIADKIAATAQERVFSSFNIENTILNYMELFNNILNSKNVKYT